MKTSKNAKIVDHFMSVETKKCSCCGIDRLKSNFNSNSRNKDGKSRVCRDCAKAARQNRKIKTVTKKLESLRTQVMPLVTKTSTTRIFPKF